MLDQIGVWADMVTYNSPNTLIWKYMWYNQWPHFISSHEQLDQGIGYWSRFERLNCKKLWFNHLRLPRRSMNALIEEEMKMNLIRRMQHLLSPMNSPFLILPILFNFCHLLLWANPPFPFIILLFTFSHLLSCHFNFCNYQLYSWIHSTRSFL